MVRKLGAFKSWVMDEQEKEAVNMAFEEWMDNEAGKIPAGRDYTKRLAAACWDAAIKWEQQNEN